VSARSEILGRIRDANAGLPATPAVRRDYQQSGPLSGTDAGAERLALFAGRVADYRATVRRCTSGDEAGEIADVLARLGIRQLVYAPGVPAGWLAELGREVRSRADGPGLDARALDRVDAALTGAAAGIAETGTVVLDGSPKCGRRILTLVPDTHICVIRAEDVLASVPEAVAVLDRSAPLTFVSGPSATSDIELQRVEGVHGPRTLVVVIVEPAG
jgi:L-lactate dehydrogenase complex protein LldG